MKSKQRASAPQRTAKGHWAPGNTGNSLGRPRTALSELCRREISKRGLVAGLGAIFARTGKYKDAAVADSIRAAQLMLAYGFGPPRPEESETANGTIRVIYEKRSRVEITGTASGAVAGDLREAALQCDGVREKMGEIDAGG